MAPAMRSQILSVAMIAGPTNSMCPARAWGQALAAYTQIADHPLSQRKEGMSSHAPRLPGHACTRIATRSQKSGEAGHRSQCLSHAKRALYHLSYIPIAKWPSCLVCRSRASLGRPDHASHVVTLPDRCAPGPGALPYHFESRLLIIPVAGISKLQAMTVWPSGLRRWLQAPVRKGVGSNPTAVICSLFCALARPAIQILGGPRQALGFSPRGWQHRGFATRGDPRGNYRGTAPMNQSTGSEDRTHDLSGVRRAS